MTSSIIGQAGTFATIQAAVTAAANGATISVTAGTYTENVTITDKWVTIDGDKSGGAVNLNGQITVDGTLHGAFAITDLNINATGKPYGVFVSAASTNFAGSVTLDGVAISHAQQDGFAYIRALNGSTPTHPDTIGAVSILNSTFSDNATVTGANGRGDILLFGYNQDRRSPTSPSARPAPSRRRRSRCAASRIIPATSSTSSTWARMTRPATSRSTT